MSGPRLPQFVVTAAESVYARIFHEKMPNEVRGFLTDFSFVAMGTVIAVALSFVFNIVAGRILGPERFGEFTLIQSVAAFLSFPMSLGIGTAMVKYSAESRDRARLSRIISSAYLLILALIIVSLAGYLIFSPQLSKLFVIPPDLFLLAIILAVITCFYLLTTNTLRGMDKMKTLALFQPVYAAILLLAFLLFARSSSLSSRSAVFSLYLGYGVTGVVLLVLFILPYIRLKIDRSWAKTLGTYGIFAAIGGLASVLYANSDRILLNRYLTLADVGVYKAYVMASIGIMGTLFEVFNIVFFPAASKYEDKRTVFHMLNRLVPYAIVIGLPFALICEFVILKLFGRQYPINVYWLVLFAVASVVWVVDGIYGWFFNSIGRGGMRLSATSAACSAVSSVALNLVLIPLAGIPGAMASMIVSLLLGIAILLVSGRKYLRVIKT